MGSDEDWTIGFIGPIRQYPKCWICGDRAETGEDLCLRCIVGGDDDGR